MHTINVYFNFLGNTEEAMNFYKSVFGGEYKTISKFKDMPPMEGHPVSEEMKEKRERGRKRGGERGVNQCLVIVLLLCGVTPD